MAPMKCKKGFRMAKGRCVKARGESFFKPKSDIRKGILWTALVAVILSGILGATFFLFGEFNDTAIKIISTTSIIGFGAMLMLGFTRFKDKIVSSVTISSTILIVFMFILNLWDFTDFRWWKLWATFGVLSAGNILGLLSYADKNKFLKYAGPIATTVSAILFLTLTWEWVVNPSDTFIRWSLISAVVAFALAHVSLINSARGARDNLVKIIFWAVVVLITIMTGMLVYLIFNVGEITGDTFFRFLGFVGILDIAGSITLPILKKVRG